MRNEKNGCAGFIAIDRRGFAQARIQGVTAMSGGPLAHRREILSASDCGGGRCYEG